MPELPRRILVPTDFSSIAANARRFAGGLARSLGAELHILHVQVILEDPHLDAEQQRRLEALVAAADEEREVAMGPDTPERDLSVTTHLVRSVSAAEAVVASIAQLGCDLVVMGTHGRRGLKHLVLGSVAEEVVRSSTVPVMTVGPHVERGSGAIKNILVPHDFSRHSRAAFELALCWARALAAKVQLLHVVEPVVQPELYAVDLMPRSLTQEIQERSLSALEEMAEDVRDLELDTAVAVGRAGDQIIERAQAGPVDLIVMGTRGLSPIKEMLLGSVAEDVLRRSVVPLLSVRTG